MRVGVRKQGDLPVAEPASVFWRALSTHSGNPMTTREVLKCRQLGR